MLVEEKAKVLLLGEYNCKKCIYCSSSDLKLSQYESICMNAKLRLDNKQLFVKQTIVECKEFVHESYKEF